MAIALLPSDIKVHDDESISGSVEALFLTGVTDPERVEDTIDSAVDYIEAQGESLPLNHRPLGQFEVTTVSMEDVEDLPLDIEPGYVVLDEWLAVGSTFDSLERLHDVVSGAASSLASKRSIAILMEAMPRPVHFIAYADIAGILDMAEGAMPEDALREYHDMVKPVLDPFAAALLAYSLTEDQFRLTARVSLRESRGLR